MSNEAPLVFSRMFALMQVALSCEDEGDPQGVLDGARQWRERPSNPEAELNPSHLQEFRDLFLPRRGKAVVHPAAVSFVQRNSILLLCDTVV